MGSVTSTVRAWAPQPVCGCLSCDFDHGEPAVAQVVSPAPCKQLALPIVVVDAVAAIERQDAVFGRELRCY